MVKKFSASDIKSGITAVTCSCIYGILMGTPRLSSLLFVESMTRFGVDRQQASFPFFLCYAIRNAFGPLIGYLGGRFGQTNMLKWGCLLSSVAVGGCFFAEDIVTVTVLWGVLFGFSFGLGIAFIPQILSMHFSNHLDKAIGVYTGGECIASLLLILLTEFLLKTYGLSGTFLILSGIVLQTIPAAMLIKKPKQTNQNIFKKVSIFQSAMKYDPDNEKEKPVISGSIEQNINHESTENNVPNYQNTGQSESSHQESILKLDSDTNNEQAVPPKKPEQKMKGHECIGKRVSTIPIQSEQKLDPKSSIYGFRIFLNPTYILILLIQGTMLYIFTLSNTILVDISRDHGVSIDDVVYVLMFHQVADAVGRFTLGIFTDRGYLSKANFLALCFTAIGLLLVVFIWIRGFTGMVIFVLGLGVFFGGLNVLSPSIIMQYVEKDFFSVAIPSRFFLYMPISFTQAPLIGFFRDKLQSYNGLIYIVIVMCFMNSILSLLVPLMERYRQNKRNGLQVKDSSQG